jgi:glycerate kinase
MEYRMKIVLAPDSFKGCLSAVEVARAMEQGARRAAPESELMAIPLADGGEGTVEALVLATGGAIKSAVVLDPLRREITAAFGMLGDGETAVVEMAAASGLPLLKPSERKPLETTSYGTGELIHAALKCGCTRCIMGLGGSATVDCGAGMLQALGMKFFRADGSLIAPGCDGEDLGEIEKIDASVFDARVGQCRLLVASDVKNPLLGTEGAARVFAPQKGASPSEIEQLEANLGHFAALVEGVTGKDIRDVAGAGAAGGLGAALLAFFNSEIHLGIDIVLAFTRFAEKIRGTDLIITGEGQIDYQTAYGKTCSGVARVAAEGGIAVVAIVGAIGERVEEVKAMGISEIVAISRMAESLDESFSRASEFIVLAAEKVVRNHLRK